MEEVSNSNTLLLNLNRLLTESSSKEPWHREVQALAVKDGILDQYARVLQDILAKIKPENKLHRIANRLMWKSVKTTSSSF